MPDLQGSHTAAPAREVTVTLTVGEKVLTTGIHELNYTL
jgi:hypothetical protein